MRSIQPFISILFLFYLASPGFAQSIANPKYIMQTSGDEVKYLINYDIQSPFDNIPCQVKVKLTAVMNGINNTFYVKEVTGDVGDLIYPGANKKIIWDYQKELIHFSGEIKLDIEIVPSMHVDRKIKKGKELSVTLAPIYTTNKTYSTKLFQGGKEIAKLKDVMLTENKFQMQIPKETKVKGNYQLVITDGEKTFFSNTFSVRHKVSLGWVVVPIVAVPTYLLVKQYIDDNKSLPGPPGSGYPDGN